MNSNGSFTYAENYCTRCGRWTDIVFAFLCRRCTDAYYSHPHNH